jgi:uncharacterized membrane protein
VIQTFKLQKHIPLLVIIVTLFILAFYQVGSEEALAHDHVLAGGDFAAAAVCHRISERSFSINGRAMPLCARCSGIYLGILATFVVLGLAGRSRWADFPTMPILVFLVGLIGIMGVDGINSYTHFFNDFPHVYTPRNWLRVVTGMGTGLAIGNFMFPAIAQTLWKEPEWRPTINSFKEMGLLILLGGVLVLLILSNQPTLLYVLALASVAGILMIFTAINTMLLLILFRREGQYTRWREATLPLVMGLIMTIAELGLISGVRYAALGTISGLPGL